MPPYCTQSRRFVLAERTIGEPAAETLRHGVQDIPPAGEGEIQYRVEMIDGLEQASAALIGLLRGDAFGKRVVKLSD